MNQNLRPLIKLSEINSLPDGHLHSKISYLKSIINEQQNPEILQMKQKMYKMSYTIKNIGIHGEQIGITSKRMPLKSKQTHFTDQQIHSDRQKQIYRKKILPQNTFYSQGLIPIKKIKDSEEKDKSESTFLVTSSNFNKNEYPQLSNDGYKNTATKFSKKMSMPSKLVRNFSHTNNFKSVLKRQQTDKQKQFIKKVTIVKRCTSEPKLNDIKKFSNRKSFAKILNECHIDRKQVEIVPIQHEENPLFKKIKKLQTFTLERKQILNKNYLSLRTLSRGSSTFVGRYHAMMTTARTIQSRNRQSRNQ